MTCQPLTFVYGPCGQCGTKRDRLHLVDAGGVLGLLCPQCCPIHSTAPALPDREVVAIDAVQEPLF